MSWQALTSSTRSNGNCKTGDALPPCTVEAKSKVGICKSFRGDFCPRGGMLRARFAVVMDLRKRYKVMVATTASIHPGSEGISYNNHS